MFYWRLFTQEELDSENGIGDVTFRIKKLVTDDKNGSLVDVAQLMLVTLISLFNQDGIELLEDRESISRFQNKYLVLLHRYLKEKYKEKANSRLYDSVMIYLDARNFHSTMRGKLYPGQKC